MLDAHAQAAAGLQHPADLGAHRGHVVDVHERVVGDDEIERPGAKRQHRAVGEQVTRAPIRLGGQPGECR
jgi:hypothetical protein